MYRGKGWDKTLLICLKCFCSRLQTRRERVAALYLVFVEQVLGTVGDPASIVLDAKCMLGPLWGCKAWVLN